MNVQYNKNGFTKFNRKRLHLIYEAGRFGLAFAGDFNNNGNIEFVCLFMNEYKQQNHTGG